MATDTRANFWAILKADSSQAITEFNKVSKATDTVGKSTSSLEGKFSSTMKKLAIATGVGFGVGAIVNYGKTAVTAAARLEQSMGATEAVFRGNTAEMNRWAEGAAESMGLSEAAARESLSLIGAQLKNFGFSLDEAQSQGQGLVQLGADLAATYGGTTVDAVSAVTAALRGERDPIERFGVSINEATVKAKALAMGLYNGTGTITQNAKATATLALIYDQASDAAGQFARESDTVAGANQIAAAKAENAAASIGEALAPAYAQAVKLATKVSEAVVFLAGSEQAASDSMGTYIAAAEDADTTNGELLKSFQVLVKEVDKSRSVGERAGNAWNAAFGGLTDANSDSEALRNLDRLREAWHNLIDVDPAQAQRLLGVLEDLKVAADDGSEAAQAYLDHYALGQDEIDGLSDALMGYRITQGALATETWVARDAAKAHYDALGELNGRYETWGGEIGEVDTALHELNDYLDELDDRSDGLSIEQAFIDLKKEADEAWIATAEGADNAREEQIDYQQALIGTQGEVAKYLDEVMKLPPERITEILAEIDKGSIYNAETFLNALARARTSHIYITPVLLGIGGGGMKDEAIYGDPYDFGANGGVKEGWTMVGERGPELVNFSTPSRVYTANNTRDMLGGGSGGLTVVIHGNVIGSDPQQMAEFLYDSLEAGAKDGRRLSVSL
jgi:hypothetical protein